MVVGGCECGYNTYMCTYADVCKSVEHLHEIQYVPFL